MALPAAAGHAEGDFILQDRVRFQLRNGRWLRHGPMSLNVYEIGGNADLSQLTQRPVNRMEVEAVFKPANDGSLQFSVADRPGNWFDWTNHNIHREWFSMTRNNERWGSGFWSKTVAPSEHGIFLNWNDGSWNLVANKPAFVSVAFQRIDVNRISFFAHTRMFCGASGQYLQTRCGGWMDLAITNIGQFALWSAAAYTASYTVKGF